MIPPAYVVPVGFVAIVRDLDVWSGGGAMIDWEMTLFGSTHIAAGQFTVESLPQTAQWRGRQVVMPGEIIAFQSTGPTDGAICGYLLTKDGP